MPIALSPVLGATNRCYPALPTPRRPPGFVLRPVLSKAEGLSPKGRGL